MSVKSKIYILFLNFIFYKIYFNNEFIFFPFRFERQICVDQEGCTKPDVKADFSSKEDAIKRLIRYVKIDFESTFKLNLNFSRYHCMHEEIKDENDPKESYEIEEKSKLILASFQAMKEKFQHLLIKQSQVRGNTTCQFK